MKGESERRKRETGCGERERKTCLPLMNLIFAVVLKLVSLALLSFILADNELHSETYPGCSCQVIVEFKL